MTPHSASRSEPPAVHHPQISRSAWYPTDPDGPNLQAAGGDWLPPIGSTDFVEDHDRRGSRVWCTTRPLSAAIRHQLRAAGWQITRTGAVTRFHRSRS